MGLFLNPSAAAGQMQSDGLKEEASVVGVLTNAIAHLQHTRRDYLQRGRRPPTGHAGHPGHTDHLLL